MTDVKNKLKTLTMFIIKSAYYIQDGQKMFNIILASSA